MIALIQRVLQARVDIAGATVGAIDQGLLVLLCAERGDDAACGERLLAKLLKLRVFADEAGKMNRSVQDVGGGLLIVSQFTLAADVWSGNRPSFGAAAAPDVGRTLYEAFVARARATNASYSARPTSGAAAAPKLGRLPLHTSAANVNWLTIKRPPPTSCTLRFILPASSANTRSLSSLASKRSPQPASSPRSAHSSTSRPWSMAPTTCSAMTTWACATR